MSTGQTIHLMVTDPGGTTAYYEIVEVNVDSALHYTITAKPAGK
jgi:hypothetical protein